MGRNARRRRLAKAKRKALAAKLRVPTRWPHRPTAYIDLVDYIAQRWHPFDEAGGKSDTTRTLTRRQVRRLLVGGKVNVNGTVYAYTHYPKHLIERDKQGRPRVMVEGYPDTRPPESDLVLSGGGVWS